MAEDQVVVGDKVEEPDVQLLCIVALKNNPPHQNINKNEPDLRVSGRIRDRADLCSAQEANHADARGRQLSAGHALKVGAHTHFTQVLEAFHLVHLSADQHGHGLQHASWKHTQRGLRRLRCIKKD